MSGFSPTGNSPANLSTSMGLSDPRLRRALQHSQLAADNLGFGLRLDGDGRISIDSTKLAADEATITSIIQSFKNIGGTTNIDNSVGDVDNSTTNNYNVGTDILNDLLWGTEMGAAVDLINTAVGLPALWSTGDTAILNRLQYLPRELWTPPVESLKKFSSGQTLTHVHPLPNVNDSVRKNLHWYMQARYEDEDMSQDKEVAIVANAHFYDGTGASLGAVALNRADWSGVTGQFTLVGRSTSTSTAAAWLLAASDSDRLLLGTEYYVGEENDAFTIDTVLATDGAVITTVPSSATEVRVKYAISHYQTNHNSRGPTFTIRDQMQYTQAINQAGDGLDPLT